MSMNFGWSAVNAEQFIDGVYAIRKNDATKEQIKKYMEIGGTIMHEWFVLLCVDYWKEYNPEGNTHIAINKLIGIGPSDSPGSWEVFNDLGPYERSEGVELYDFDEDFDWEKFLNE